MWPFKKKPMSISKTAAKYGRIESDGNGINRAYVNQIWLIAGEDLGTFLSVEDAERAICDAAKRNIERAKELHEFGQWCM